MKTSHKPVVVTEPASLWRDFDKWDSGVTVRETGVQLRHVPSPTSLDDEVGSLFDGLGPTGF